MAFTKLLVAMTGSLVVAQDDCYTTMVEHISPSSQCCPDSNKCNISTCGTSECKGVFDNITKNAESIGASLKNCTGEYAWLAGFSASRVTLDTCKKLDGCGFEACPMDPKTCLGAMLIIESRESFCPKGSCGTDKCRELLDTIMTKGDDMIDALKSCTGDTAKAAKGMADYFALYVKGLAYETQVECGFVESPCNMNNACFESCGDVGPVKDCSTLTKLFDGCASSCNECHKNLMLDWMKCNGDEPLTNDALRLPLVGLTTSLVLGMTLALVGLA
eukprot:TRINITY_DN8649_c0_g1_i1.p1 TRINITY_DN8649_c0_g1~~TRINITY_DN8649_c0_g1_i1.p1  ORF type:complete len:293 (+),score=51.53 TRINITY_DN8649_c0_g1_i1:56-880(+)